MRNECLEKVTKYELSILRRLAMAQEKPEGGPFRPPPPGIGFQGSASFHDAQESNNH